MIFCFQRSTNKIFTPDFTEIFSSLKCTWYFVCFVLLCPGKFVYHYITLSLFSLKTGDRRVDGYFVACGMVICRCDKLLCHRWGCQLDDLLFFDDRLMWYSHPILMWYLHHWNVHDISIQLFYYALISSLPYHCSVRFLFSLIVGDRRVGGLFRLWWHRELSLRRFGMLLVAAGLSAWWSSVFSARLKWYLHTVSLWHLHRWNVHDMLWNCFIMLR